MNTNQFNSLALNPLLVENLTSLGYHQMTPIQAQSLPHIIEQRDLVGQAKTGSGKTAAFGLGILHHLDVKKFAVQSLVLCPTRELADQVAKELRRLARSIHNIKILTLCGGAPLGPQIASLEHGAHIIIGTPGRIEDHLRKQTLKLGAVQHFVLDEADRMLDMGFLPAIENVISELPAQRQTLLFSATFPADIDDICRRILRDPVYVRVESIHDTAAIEQIFYQVEEKQRSAALIKLLYHHQPESTVVFCTTKKETEEVADQLKQVGISATALHGDLEQKTRDQVLVRFSNRSISVLVATDVAARGLDISKLDAVINYRLARDSEIHVHRVGRTGRAGERGFACTLVGNEEGYKLERLANTLGQKITAVALPKVNSEAKNTITAPMRTLQIDGGKKQKLRPGDILGALTRDQALSGDDIGKIDIFDYCAYVAISKAQANTALKVVQDGQLKGKNFRSRLIWE